jgi:hypothetical protein
VQLWARLDVRRQLWVRRVERYVERSRQRGVSLRRIRDRPIAVGHVVARINVGRLRLRMRDERDQLRGHRGGPTTVRADALV